jgi:HD superfamily phosphohydrolase
MDSNYWILIIFIVSFLLAFISTILGDLYKKREKQQRHIYVKKEQELLDKYKEESSTLTDDEHKEYFINLWSTKSILKIKNGTKSEIEAEATKKVNEVIERIEKIEERFPEESSLEKIASVNDAILGTKIEDLTESMKRIEENMLTKWDVVKIMFTIITCIIALITITIGILNYLK